MRCLFCDTAVSMTIGMSRAAGCSAEPKQCFMALKKSLWRFSVLATCFLLFQHQSHGHFFFLFILAMGGFSVVPEKKKLCQNDWAQFLHFVVFLSRVFLGSPLLVPFLLQLLHKEAALHLCKKKKKKFFNCGTGRFVTLPVKYWCPLCISTSGDMSFLDYVHTVTAPVFSIGPFLSALPTEAPLASQMFLEGSQMCVFVFVSVSMPVLCGSDQSWQFFWLSCFADSV